MPKWISFFSAIGAAAMGFTLAAAAGPATNPTPLIRPTTQRTSTTMPANFRGSIYGPSPNHLWNRVHRALLVRNWPNGTEFGYDTLDPLLWDSTRHLLQGSSHDQAIAVLDEFLWSGGAKRVTDPLKRAIFQRDLWAVLDWAAAREKDDRVAEACRDLELRLATIIARVALSPQQIAELPDVYELAARSGRFAADYDRYRPFLPFLPPELFDASGPWIEVTSSRGDLIAPMQAHAFGGRAVFQVFFRHPDGRKAGLAYLKRLDSFARPWIEPTAAASTAGELRVNPDLPQFPSGTQVALVRRPLLIDNQGKIRATRLVDSIQIRVFRNVPQDRPARPEDQDFHELRLRRRELLRDPVLGLRALPRNEKEIPSPQFVSAGMDWFETSTIADAKTGEPTYAVMRSCFDCHSGAGIQSVHSFTRRFNPPRDLALKLEEASSDSQSVETIAFKQQRFEWGVLQGILRQRQTVRLARERIAPGPAPAPTTRQALADPLPAAAR
jgi:hypothetical protein